MYLNPDMGSKLKCMVTTDINMYYSMAWSAIWEDIARVGVSYFLEPKASENIAHESNVLPYYMTNH